MLLLEGIDAWQINMKKSNGPQLTDMKERTKVGRILLNDNQSSKTLRAAWCYQLNWCINNWKKNPSATNLHWKTKILQWSLPKHHGNSDRNVKPRLLHHIYHKSKMDGDTDRPICRKACGRSPDNGCSKSRSMLFSIIYWKTSTENSRLLYNNYWMEINVALHAHILLIMANPDKLTVPEITDKIASGQITP